MLMANVQFPGSKGCENQMEMHTTTHKEDISLAKYFQKHLSNTKKRMVLLIKISIKNLPVNESGMIVSILFNIVLMLTMQVSKVVVI